MNKITRRDFIKTISVPLVMFPFGRRPAIKAPEPQEIPVTLANRSVFAFEPWGISGAGVRDEIEKICVSLNDPSEAQFNNAGAILKETENCPAHCVILESQGRQNEPPVVYEVCDNSQDVVFWWGIHDYDE